MKMIAPSILSANFVRLEEEIGIVEEGGADLLHIDVMDGHFVPNITIGPPVVKSIAKIAKLPLDVHLMIEEPMKYLDDFIEAGSKAISVHAEVSPHLHRTIQRMKERGIKTGIALNPSTSLSCLEYLLGEIDFVLLMTVNPGFGGQVFIKEMLPKINALKRMIKEKSPDTLIEVDGGIKLENIFEVSQAGGDIFVAGSAVFRSQDKKKMIQEMKRELLINE